MSVDEVAAELTSPTASGAVRVLVVDDSPDHRVLMTRALSRAGFVTGSVGTAEQAMAIADDVDLVLLDYRMPGHNGLDVLRELRRRPRPPAVVMVTSMGSTDVAVDAMRAGATDYVSKGQGYLDTLPEVVRRAWHTHDLEARAAELQRLALLVTSAGDQDALFGEVVQGAQRLLRARSCVLVLVADGRLEASTSLGPRPDDLDDVLATGPDELAGWTGPRIAPGRLLVPLPRHDDEPLGLLAAWTDGREASAGEADLACAFASFAGIALANLRKRELERRLVAELQSTVDARRDFIASISHELRTPLTCISGFAGTLQQYWPELSDEERTDLLARVNRNTDDLQSLVDELIDLAALERGQPFQVRLDAVDADDLVGTVVRDAAATLAEREVVVELDGEPVIVDAGLVRRTLQNLLTNAVKFSVTGSRVTVRTRAVGGAVRIEVVDEGAGLDPSDAARVFDPFFRAGSSVRNAVRGSGIGLALVREYVRTMGGRVGVQSVPGEGSTFWFTVPTVAAHPDPDQATKVPGVAGGTWTQQGATDRTSGG